MFSVVIPLWNKRQTVAASVTSVLAQTYRDLELIIVDDGSTDGGRDVLAGFTDPRIKIVAQRRIGPGGARNTGIRASRADWIAFLDADDLWLPYHLAELDRIRTAHRDAGLIGTAFGESPRCEEYQPPCAGKPRIESLNLFERAVAGKPCFCMSSTAIPRRTYTELGGFCAALQGQDDEYFVRIALDRKVVASSLVTTIYRVRTGGITDATARRRLNRIESLRDLGPVVEAIIDRYASIECPRMRRAADRYIEGQYRGWIRRSARTGDFSALRLLPQIRPGKASLDENMILLVAQLPRPLARAAFALAYRMIRLTRAFIAGANDPSAINMPPESTHHILEQVADEARLDRAECPANGGNGARHTTRVSETV